VSSLADAYSATGHAWETGPGLVYNRLAAIAVEMSPVPLTGRTILDLGAGTGAASRAIAAAGGSPIALDAAFGMLADDRARRPPATQGDALALPFRDAAFGGLVAAFSLNHLGEPARALRECARVVEGGGPIIASTYAGDDAHPVRAAVTTALSERGFDSPEWYQRLSSDDVPLLASLDRCAAVIADADIAAVAQPVRVPYPDLDPAALIEWRLGMAQHAPFVAALDAEARSAVVARAIELLGADPPMLERSIIVITAVS
jgi:SAM-dependent methyltransferase